MSSFRLCWVGYFTSVSFAVRSGPLDSTAARRQHCYCHRLCSAWPYRAAPQRLSSSSCCSDVAVRPSSLVDLQSATRKLATDYSNKNVVGVTSGNFENHSLKTKRLIHLSEKPPRFLLRRIHLYHPWLMRLKRWSPPTLGLPPSPLHSPSILPAPFLPPSLAGRRSRSLVRALRSLPPCPYWGR